MSDTIERFLMRDHLPHRAEELIQMLVDDYDSIINSNRLGELIDYVRETARYENYIHLAVGHARITSTIVEFLMGIEGPIHLDDDGHYPIHMANRMANRPDDDGYYPIHILCLNKDLDAGQALQILQLFVNWVPLCAEEWTDTHGSYGEHLPINIAIENQMTSSFIVKLYTVYHDTPQQRIIIDQEGTRMAPIIHLACRYSRDFDTIKGILDADPDCINYGDEDGSLPIHHAVAGASHHCERGTVRTSDTQIIKLLLLLREPSYDNDLTNDKKSPFHWLGRQYWLLDGPGEGTELVPTLYDAYPEAFPKLYTEYILEGNQFVSDTLPFLLEQMQYLQQFNQCTLPLHYALMNDEPLPLGTIKLLANAQRIDEECPTTSTLPLHLACMFSTLNVVKYLVGQNNTLLGEKDSEGNYPLHHACIGGNLKIIYYLVKQDGATESMSTANKDGDSPINLLVKYAPSAFKFPPITFFLLQAMPQTVSQLTAIEIDSDDEDLFWSDQEDLSDDDQPY